MTTILHAVLLLNALLVRVSSSDESELNDWTDTTWPEHPFMAFLYMHDGDSATGGYLCGGSIVATDEWQGNGVILTAAHCVVGADDVGVGVGCTQTDCSDEIAAVYDDAYYVVHPDYDADMASSNIHWLDNDIALVFLAEPIEVPGARRVELHNDISVLANDENVTVFGYWGSCEGSADGCSGGSDTDTLEFAQTNFMPADECDDIWGQFVSSPHDFCVRDDNWKNGRQSICSGDSGSPSLVDGKQIGLNSWGVADCNPASPTVLTSVPYYFGWIAAQCPECVGLTVPEGEGPGMPIPPSTTSTAQGRLVPGSVQDDDWDDVAAEVVCGRDERFYLLWGDEDRFLRLRLDEATNVTLSNCDTYFETILKLWSQDRSEELSRTLGGCGVINSCECRTCCNNMNEEIWIEALPAGTYFVQIGFFAGRYEAQYDLKIECGGANIWSRTDPVPTYLSPLERELVVAGEVACGADMSFAVAMREESRYFRFRLDEASDVTLSNCDTTFDTMLKLWSEDRSEELSLTLGGCNGDDCGCPTDYYYTRNEQFSIAALPAGTYYVQAGSDGSMAFGNDYWGFYAGDYKLKIECSPPGAINPEPIDPELAAPELEPEVSEPAPELELVQDDDWDDVAAEVACGADQSFPVARHAQSRYLRFRLDQASDVTLSNCETTFDTILKLWSQDRSEELSRTLGGCNGDDCGCSWADASNELFSISALPAGTYYVQAGSYGGLMPDGSDSGYYAGDYKLKIECSPPAASDGLSRLSGVSAQGVHVSRDLLAVALLVCVLMLAMLLMWPRTPSYAKVQTLDDSEQATQSEAEEILHVAD